VVSQVFRIGLTVNRTRTYTISVRVDGEEPTSYPIVEQIDDRERVG
jgi:hypothetical protein